MTNYLLALAIGYALRAYIQRRMAVAAAIAIQMERQQQRACKAAFKRGKRLTAPGRRDAINDGVDLPDLAEAFLRQNQVTWRGPARRFPGFGG